MNKSKTIRIPRPSDPLQPEIDRRLAAKRGEIKGGALRMRLNPDVRLMVIAQRLMQIAEGWK